MKRWTPSLSQIVFLIASVSLATCGIAVAPAAASSGTTINVIADCFGAGAPSAIQAGQALVGAMQAAQDGNASGECSGLGTSLSGPYTLVLNPSYTYELTQVNNYTDGPDGLPAVIGAVTIESATSAQAVIEALQPGGGGQTFRILDISAPISGTTAQYEQPGGTWVNTPSPGGNLTLRDVTLEGGDASGASSNQGGGGLGAGGAIFNQGGVLNLAGSSLTGNLAQGGQSSVAALSGAGGGGMGPNVSSGGGGGMETGGASDDGGQPNGGAWGVPGVYGGYGGGGGFGGDGGWGAAGPGGNGGFGGGGGAGGPGGSGGFGGGGGGGGTRNGGDGGFGGGAGAGSQVNVGGGFGGGGGTASGGGGGLGAGGAIFDYEGTATISSGSLTSNEAIGGTDVAGGVGQGMGGAIFQYGGSLTITGTTVTGNTTNGGFGGFGGGIYLYGATTDPVNVGIPSDISGPATARLMNAVITGNSAVTDSNISQIGSVTLLVATLPAALRFLGLSSPATSAGPGSILTASQGAVGQFFFEVLQSAGGVDYGIWSLKSGALPPGVNLEPSGALIGTPTQAGAYTFTAQVEDLAGDIATHTLTTTITSQ